MNLRTTTSRPRRLAAVVATSTLALAGLAACGADNESGVGSSALEERVEALERRVNDLSAGGSGGSGSTASPADDGSTLNLSGRIAGAGSSAQAAAMEAWIAAFTDLHPDLTINYEPSGSGAGREQFSAGAVPFAGSDAALDPEELAAAEEVCGDIVQVPLYVSPIAVAFNLDGIDELQLSPETLARIFDQQITNWNDAAIAADNPDVELPDLAITAVNRADESGTTENFVEYLKAAAPDAWPHEVSGDWPVAGGEAAQGTSGVVGAINGGDGTIGYADASQIGDLGVVKVGVGDDFVEPSSEAAAKILGASELVPGQGDASFTYELDRATDEAGTYPVVLVSYNLACTEYESESDAESVKAFFAFIASEEGQQVAAEAAGAAPLSAEQREQYLEAIESIAGGA